MFCLVIVKLSPLDIPCHTQIGTFAYRGENLGAKELNIPNWVWHRGQTYSNFAVNNSAVGFRDIAHSEFLKQLITM